MRKLTPSLEENSYNGLQIDSWPKESLYLLTPLRNRGDGAQENKMAKKATLEQLTFSMMWIRLQTSRLYWNGYFALSVVNTYCSFIVVGCRTLSFPQQYRGGRVSRFWSYYAHAYTHPSPPPSHLAPLPLSGSPERATLLKLICLLQHWQGVVDVRNMEWNEAVK